MNDGLPPVGILSAAIELASDCASYFFSANPGISFNERQSERPIAVSFPAAELLDDSVELSGAAGVLRVSGTIAASIFLK